MGAWESWVLDSAGTLILLIVGCALALVLRRRWLSRHGGTFEMSCRIRSSGHGRGWILGVGRYAADDLEWFRVFSFSARPKRRWNRAELSFTSSRPAAGFERAALYAGHVVVELETPDEPLFLAMSPAALTGLQAWLEAGPPGLVHGTGG